jgi:hypothetical protein
MLHDLLALIDKPVLLVIVMTVGGVIGMTLENALNRIEREKRSAYWRGRNSAKGAQGKIVRLNGNDRPAADAAADQLKTVMKADFKPRPLLNRPEGQVFKALDRIVLARNPRWQVMAQVSLGEFVASGNEEAYRCINSKRVDFALMDGECRVRQALEYQGAGHHQGTAAARDAVKKEALRKAGIGYHEIVAGHTTPAELKRLIEKLVPTGEGETAA